MSIPTEGPNPLRPYYIPPSVGSPSNTAQNISSAANASHKYASSRTATTSFGSSARNILADMDYSDYLSDSSPSPGGVMRVFLEQALWRYMSLFLAQPFDVAKMILQVRLASNGQKSWEQAPIVDNSRRRSRKYKNESYEISSDDSDPDSPSYFTSAAPLSPTSSRSSHPRHRRGSSGFHSQPHNHTTRTPPFLPKAPHTLELKSSSSLMGVISSLWATEGSWGIWKGTNITYIHSILLSTITSFTRSFLSALLALPDPGVSFQLPSSFTNAGGIDILSSPSPLTSLTLAVSAAGIAGIVLAPLDIARTKLILTPSTHPPRSILSTLKSLPSWTLPWSIASVATIHTILPTAISVSTPLFLRSKVGIDPILTPTLYTLATFVGQTLELGLKLPVETVLRRGQLNVVCAESRSEELQTIVEVGPYRGLFGTLHHIVYDEGESEVSTDAGRTTEARALKLGKSAQQRQKRKGQGFEGLWRGWRVGMWGIVGVWGAATLGGVGGKGGEF